MAFINTTINFSLPEDTSSDVIELHQSNVKDSNYALYETNPYNYGITELANILIDDTKWYRIRFRNLSDGTVSAFSDPIYGGSYLSSGPFLAVTGTTSGANYASVTDVYEYANLIPEDIPVHRVSSALKRARAVIDIRTSEMDFERFQNFDEDTARRKYNASLRILKEAEICMALGNLYQNMSDDRIIENMRRDAPFKPGGISIGNTSISGDTMADRNENILYLATLASRYFGQAEILLSTLDTNSVRLTATDYMIRSPRFLYPFNGWF